MHTRSPQVWFSLKFTAITCIAFIAWFAVGTVAYAQPAPTPTQAQAPAAAQTQIASEKATQAPLRSDCGGKNQPPCGPPDCGGLNGDCCTGNKCRGTGLVCKNGTCVSSEPPCGGMDEACSVHRNPVCNNNLLKCAGGNCTAGTIVRDLKVTLHTTVEDKDPDTGIRVAIDGLTTWSQTEDLGYNNGSTHVWPLNPPAVRLDDLAGRYVSTCMKPNGDDTWKFNFLLQELRSDGLTCESRKDKVFLSRDVPCLSWDATPDPTPNGPIAAGDGKCLTITKGGAVGSLVALKDCVGGSDQEWVLVPLVSAPSPDGARTREIRRLPSECLGLQHGGTDSGTFVELQNCVDAASQKWKWFGDPTPDQSRPTRVTGPLGRCLDPRDKGEVVGGTLPGVGASVDTSLHFLHYLDCDGSSSQNWTMPVCGVEGKACCESGMPCQGPLSCNPAVRNWPASMACGWLWKLLTRTKTTTPRFLCFFLSGEGVLRS